MRRIFKTAISILYLVKVDLNIISHIVLDDKIFYSEQPPRKIEEQLGGPAAYASMVIPLFQSDTQCITSVGRDFPEGYLLYLNSIKNYGLKLELSEKTTRFLHEIYRDYRTLFLLSQAQSLDNSLFLLEGGKACLLSPVFEEISRFSVEWSKENHDWVGVDVQGFARKKDENGKIYSYFNRDFFNYLIQKNDFIKFSLKEAMEYTNQKTYRSILEKLPKNNVQVVTLGNKGIIYSDEGQFYQLDAPEHRVKDPTGAGDVFITAFLIKYLETEEVDFSLAFGMALAAEKVQMDEIQILPKRDYVAVAEKILESKKAIK
jgi:sugar/nucleoside kinase (ribokinase family)